MYLCSVSSLKFLRNMICFKIIQQCVPDNVLQHMSLPPLHFFLPWVWTEGNTLSYLNIFKSMILNRHLYMLVKVYILTQLYTTGISHHSKQNSFPSYSFPLHVLGYLACSAFFVNIYLVYKYVYM